MNKQKIVNLYEYGSSMGTRELGCKIRKETLSLIEDGFCVFFDFSDIKIISSAFADELFGKLYVELGEQIFKDKVKVNNFDDEESKNVILLIINKGIMFRKNRNDRKERFGRL